MTIYPAFVTISKKFSSSVCTSYESVDATPSTGRPWRLNQHLPKSLTAVELDKVDEPSSFDAMATSLPTPRQFITSLINSLPIPPATVNTATASNPLADLPSSLHTILTTLHALIPPPTLLQALDLLDRGLVTRIIQAVPNALSAPCRNVGDEEAAAVACNLPQVTPPQAQIHDHGHSYIEINDVAPPRDTQETYTPRMARDARSPSTHCIQPRSPEANELYVVRSAQEARSRGFRPSSGGATSVSGGGRSYIVRLQAWNCNCAAFAFAAFPPIGSMIDTRTMSGIADGNEDDGDNNNTGIGNGTQMGWGQRERASTPEGWEFGGLSKDGTAGAGGVPCCKHLLACLLAERWGVVLAKYVKEKRVGRKEMAGICAEG